MTSIDKFVDAVLRAQVERFDRLAPLAGLTLKSSGVATGVDETTGLVVEVRSAPEYPLEPLSMEPIRNAAIKVKIECFERGPGDVMVSRGKFAKPPSATDDEFVALLAWAVPFVASQAFRPELGAAALPASYHDLEDDPTLVRCGHKWLTPEGNEYACELEPHDLDAVFEGFEPEVCVLHVRHRCGKWIYDERRERPCETLESVGLIEKKVCGLGAGDVGSDPAA